MTASPTVSVVVPCHNSRDTIEACLASVLAQRFSEPVEVIVVDSSTDGSAELVERDFPEVRVLSRPPGKTPAGVARNAGAQQARGALLVFLDSDCVAGDGWLAKLVEAARTIRGLVGGSVSPRLPCSVIASLLHALSSSSFLPARGWRTVPFVCGANLAVERRVFLDCGGFPPELERSEDVALGALLAAQGPVVFVADATVAHEWRTSLGHALRHQRSAGYWCGRVRTLFSLEGSALALAPLLCALLVPLRFARIAGRIWASPSSRWLMVPWLCLFPLSLLLLSSWTLGFCRGVKAARGS